jgi:hypothetical protein
LESDLEPILQLQRKEWHGAFKKIVSSTLKTQAYKVKCWCCNCSKFKSRRIGSGVLSVGLQLGWVVGLDSVFCNKFGRSLSYYNYTTNIMID